MASTFFPPTSTLPSLHLHYRHRHHALTAPLIAPSITISSSFSSPFPFTLASTRTRRSPTAAVLAGGGGSTPNGGGSGRGGGDDSGGGGDDAGDRNREEAVLALIEMGRTLDSLPKDLAAAIEAGRIPGTIVCRYVELERSRVFRWLLGFGGFKERLLADDLFLAKVAMECGVGIFTKVLLASSLQKEKRKKKKKRGDNGE